MLLFWILASILTAGTVFVLVRPLLAPGPGSIPTLPSTDTAAETSDIAIYRDQLAEIETDKARGLISGPEAEAARAEVARRLLSRVDAVRTADTTSPSDTAAMPPARVGTSQLFSARTFHLVALVVPAVSLAIYLAFGSPWMPARPLADRLSEPVTAKSRIDELIARVESRLRSNPGDGMGWDVVAPVYLRLERFADAAEAYKRALDLLGENASRLSGFAEATMLAQNGVVTEPARKAYARLLELQPGRPEARIGLALADEQDGKLQAAETAYRSILADSPKDAPWRQFVDGRLAAIAAIPRNGDAAAPVQQPQLDSATVAAISELPEAERRAFVLQMVQGLETRLKTNDKDVAGWQRLLRSWSVLGEKEKAEAALRRAREALAGEQDALSRLNAFARSLGLKS